MRDDLVRDFSHSAHEAITDKALTEIGLSIPRQQANSDGNL